MVARKTRFESFLLNSLECTSILKKITSREEKFKDLFTQKGIADGTRFWKEN